MGDRGAYSIIGASQAQGLPGVKAVYEPLAAVFDLEEARQEKAPILHEHVENNLAYRGSP